MVKIPIKVEISLDEESKQVLRDYYRAKFSSENHGGTPKTNAATARVTPPDWDLICRAKKALEEWLKENANLAYTRAEVLREEWRPKAGESFYGISKSSTVTDRLDENGYSPFMSDYYAFAPTRELAEEIVAIREGKWLPKKWDVVFDLKPNLQLPILHECNGYVAGKDYLPSEWKYFPSEAQRTRYIKKQKAEAKRKAIGKIFGMDVVLDPKMEPNTIELRSPAKPCKTCGGTGKIMNPCGGAIYPCPSCWDGSPDCKREEKRICVTYSPLQSIQKGEVVKFEDGLEYVALKVWNDDNATHVKFRKLA